MYITINNEKFNIKTCTSFKDRLIGMMFKKSKLNYGLCFPKCKSIHTFFMKQNIDVIMTDKNDKVILYKKNLKPWKIISNKKAYYVYEFSENIIKNINIGDYIKK